MQRAHLSESNHMRNPLVSIIIPCYRGARFLAIAIESCLAQTYQELEVIVVDDASPDECPAIAARYGKMDGRVRTIRHNVNGGVSRAFNTGFEAARGRFFTRLAQDDTLFPHAIGTMVQALIEEPSAGLVYSDQLIVDEEGAVLSYYETPEPEEALAQGNQMGLCVMWRRTVWEAIGGFDPEFDAAEDYEYWLRVSKRYPIRKCQGGALLSFRQHAGMGSSTYSPRQAVAMARARAKHLAIGAAAARIRAEGYFEACWLYRMNGNLRSACLCSVHAIHNWPFAPLYWKSALGTAVMALSPSRCTRPYNIADSRP
jgi:glycosyltransferase involved in cell wall biosynthesis